MIASNIFLTLLFSALIALCAVFSFIAYGANAEGLKDEKTCGRLLLMAIYSAFGILGVWLSGSMSWIFWLYFGAALASLPSIYKTAINE